MLARSLGVPRKRLLGWTPSEVHEHEYDDQGRIVRTVVTREPEWDDDSRAEMLALAEYEAGMCSGCGLHRSLCSDPSNHFTFEFDVCTVAAGWAQWGRKVADEDDKAMPGKGEPPETPHPDDGRTERVRMLTPDEVAKARAGRQGSKRR
jgi:hypothetical protein